MLYENVTICTLSFIFILQNLDKENDFLKKKKFVLQNQFTLFRFPLLERKTKRNQIECNDFYEIAVKQALRNSIEIPDTTCFIMN